MSNGTISIILNINWNKIKLKLKQNINNRKDVIQKNGLVDTLTYVLVKTVSIYFETVKIKRVREWWISKLPPFMIIIFIYSISISLKIFEITSTLWCSFMGAYIVGLSWTYTVIHNENSQSTSIQFMTEQTSSSLLKLLLRDVVIKTEIL